MKLENYTYKQSNIIRYFVLSYVLLILIGSVLVYFGESKIPDILIFMNLPVALLILASFYKKNYIVVKDNAIEIFNSFKPMQLHFEDIKNVEPIGSSTWVIRLKNKRKINLSKIRVAKDNREQFKQQMKMLQHHFKQKK